MKSWYDIFMRRSPLSFVLALGLSAATLCASYAGEKVDLELVLAVDISTSMTPDELMLQREGYAAALTDPDVVRAITSGPYGRISVTFFEWAGVTWQKIVVPWTIIANMEDAEAFAKKLDRVPSYQPRRTSISGAINFSMNLFDQNPHEGIRRVIDVSGDGTNNEGPPVTEARDQAVSEGIVINGLPLMTDQVDFSDNDLANLDVYFRSCVSGGPGSFVIPVTDWSEFPAAIRRKLILETSQKIPSGQGKPTVVLARAESPYDCMIGEKLYREDPLRNRFSPENFQWPSNRPENQRR